MSTNGNVAKLENHLKLLKEEYTKLQRNYAELERNYSKATANNADETNGEFSSFVSRLVMTVATLYGRKTYSDIQIRLKDKTMPAHKFVLNARSDEWREEIISNIDELDWSDLDADVGYSFLRWIYTDAVDLQQDSLALGLLRVSHRFKLPGLMGLCERALVSSVNVRSCVRFYTIAEEVNATNLLEYCSGLISTHWDDLTAQDFEHMSGPLLYKMLKSKTKHPLHAAVRLLKEEVVFLCLVENDNKLSELVNSLSPQGQLPLGLALIGRSRAIADTLIQRGGADLNAYDGDGCSLLIDAVKRGDAFSAKYLLDANCNVNLTSRNSVDTAMHLVCTYAEKTTSDPDTFQDMLSIGEQLLTKNVDLNIQNIRGYTPLHMAIVSGHTEMIDLLLERTDMDLNIRTVEEKSALQFALTPPQTDGPPFELAKRLLDKGARPSAIHSETGDSLLQHLIKTRLESAAVFLSEFANLDHVNKAGLSALHLACEHGLADLVAALLKNNASPNMQSAVMNELKAPLHFAVAANSVDVLEAFVGHNESSASSERVDFNLKNSHGDSPLSLALAMGFKDLVPVLIRGGADVNGRNGQDMTLLHQAILKEDSQTAVFLLEQGADMNALTADQESPLQLAIHCRLPVVVDALCQSGVSLSAPDNKGDCPLWAALESNQEAIASVLVRHGVDTDCWGPGPEGCLQTLLHRAIDENRENAAIFLIKSGCDLDSCRQPGPQGQGGDEAKDKASPLNLCCQWGQTAVIQALIDHGANVNSLDCDNKTALHVAIENQHDEIISILLCHPKLDLKLRDKAGNTAFAAALISRNHKAAQSILDRLPTAAEQMDQRGRNFLHIAIMKDDLESVLFLLAIHVDVNSRVHDINQTPPLHLAAASENEMLVRNLILAGARVNDRDASTQKTALHIAAERGREANVSALLQNNCDFDAVDNERDNALHVAVREGNISVVKVLLEESQINAEAVNLKGRNPMHELCRCGKDQVAASICELFLASMPTYPINTPNLEGNTPLLLAYMRGQAPLCRFLSKHGACLGAENRDKVTIFNFQLATKQLLNRLLDELETESPWATSDSCQECDTKFTLMMRKHHCRHCGRELCNNCSRNEIPIIKFGINKPVRVCECCLDVLKVGLHG